MTVDQRLILRIEQVSQAVDRDQLLAAFQLLDDLLREVGPQRNAREAHGRGLERVLKRTPRTSNRAAAAG